MAQTLVAASQLDPHKERSPSLHDQTRGIETVLKSLHTPYTSRLHNAQSNPHLKPPTISSPTTRPPPAPPPPSNPFLGPPVPPVAVPPQPPGLISVVSDAAIKMAVYEKQAARTVAYYERARERMGGGGGEVGGADVVMGGMGFGGEGVGGGTAEAGGAGRGMIDSSRDPRLRR